MKKSILLFLFISLSAFCNAQVSLDYYLPEGITYDSSIPKPAEVLGYEVGEWHVSHDQLVAYLRVLAKSSDRVQLQEYGRTFENRPLVLLTISKPENIQNIEKIREEHLKLSDPAQSGEMKTADMPAVVWLGYSVHGNEPSGSNSSMLVAYHLVAGQGEAMDKLLDKTVILLDPSFNPDGLNRFASWVNTHKSKNLVTDPNAREFNEPFPRGRTNHYWFDLNRDWLPVQLPESQGRIAQYQAWRPNILTDHHEMGTNSTFFFQPGIPSRKNPLTPDKNVDLTGKIAKYHAKALDEIGSLYYSEESFDDFYYGKGSTYPDAQGSIGILFEQASSRGHAQESQHGVITFPFTIRNHFTASLSTLQAATEMRQELLDYQREFYQNALSEAKKSDLKAYVFGEKHDKARLFHFLEILQRHKIQVNQLSKKIDTFDSESSYIVPLAQPQSKLIQAIFRTQTEFTDSLFYDVSSWTLPLAFNLPYTSVQGKRFSSDLVGASLEGNLKMTEGAMLLGNTAVAKLPTSQANIGYAFRWDSYYAPRMAQKLMAKGVTLKVASKPFVAQSGEENISFDYGTVIVPLGVQTLAQSEVENLLRDLAKANAVDVFVINSGLTPEGIDFGSNSFRLLKLPKVAILAGGNISSYDVGETWHLLDQRMDMPVTVLDVAQFNSADLDRYTVIVLQDGSYSGVEANGIGKLKQWVREGGTLIGIQRGANWAKSNGLAQLNFKETPVVADSVIFRPYAKRSEDLGAKRIGGSIFQAELDLTHPLAYGFHENKMPIFRNDTQFALPSTNPYNTPLRYTNSPLMSGYIHKEHLEMAKNTASILVNGYGSGNVVSFMENPNFRAFWYGTNRLFLNAVFFGQTI